MLREDADLVFRTTTFTWTKFWMITDSDASLVVESKLQPSEIVIGEVCKVRLSFVVETHAADSRGRDT